ncbi:MAG: UDP-N-acetylglucosamine--N-acetylmuramyl-(pentapeptide) pyrophosphoryl-undecaprenol N-acetylglucosamine transferase [Lentisphaeria bacterium]|nr:UDP-N-acetylglucosamine--N-acetylmuramyl-(pentapeptide) pyrophosphoryl-undecaprenol N-acetylglucosamine transferase [Lentisphaeria bacterium]
MALERLVISCGGTGGHFFPGLSVARSFQDNGGRVLLLLSGIHAESQKEIAEKSGIRAVALPPMPHYRRNPLRFIKGFVSGYRKTGRELKNFDPQALLGMGSFATLPVVLAAVKKHIPLFLHDGNARIGRANRFFSRWAKFAASAFPAVNSADCRCQVMVSGMPLRPELREFAGLDKTEALAALNREFNTDFTADKPLILVTGGSQGAAVFNTVLPEAFYSAGSGFQVFHLTGKGKLSDAEKGYAKAGFPVKIVETTSKMAELLAAADLVFSRSGGSTAAELALFGKPSVLVPYPYAAEGHQSDNARHFADNGAAKLVENSDLTVSCATEIIREFLLDKEKWLKMGNNMKELSIPDAAEKLIDGISRSLD